MCIRRATCPGPLAACLLAVLAAETLAFGVESPTCGELERRFDVVNSNATSTQMNLALFAAADQGCVPLAARLLESGASLLARDRAGAMALARAARAGHVALVELFLARGAAIDARNLAGATALFGSVENERPATVALLLAKGADPNLPGRSGVTPLAAAAFRGNDRIVEQLLAGGADPDVVDQTGKAAVTYAAARGFSIVVRRLLDAGIDARRVYGNDLTALMWAAGHEDGVGPPAWCSQAFARRRCADRRHRQPRPYSAHDGGRGQRCGSGRSPAWPRSESDDHRQERKAGR